MHPHALHMGSEGAAAPEQRPVHARVLGNDIARGMSEYNDFVRTRGRRSWQVAPNFCDS